MRDDRGQAIGAMITTYQEITGCFAGGVGRVWSIRRGPGKTARWTETAVHFIGGSMMEPFAVEMLRPGAAARLQKIEGADDVGLNEILWFGDGAIHMGLCCQMENVGNGVLVHNLNDRRFVPQIDFFKTVLG